MNLKGWGIWDGIQCQILCGLGAMPPKYGSATELPEPMLIMFKLHKILQRFCLQYAMLFGTLFSTTQTVHESGMARHLFS